MARVVKSLIRLEQQIKQLCPRAVPPATDPDSWGTYADDKHPSTSDHSLHDYPGLGDDVCCAHDFPHAPALGLNGGDMTERLRLSRDPRIGYVIFHGRKFYSRVFNGVPAFTWMKHTGDDPHNTHFHVSSVHTAIADHSRDWNLGTMAEWTQDQITSAMWQLTGNPAGPLHARINQVLMKLDALMTAEGNEVDVAAIVTGVVNALAADPNVDVTDAEAEKIAKAVRAQFTNVPLQ